MGAFELAKILSDLGNDLRSVKYTRKTRIAAWPWLIGRTKGHEVLTKAMVATTSDRF
jgi:hypothetical protein